MRREGDLGEEGDEIGGVEERRYRWPNIPGRDAPATRLEEYCFGGWTKSYPVRCEEWIRASSCNYCETSLPEVAGWHQGDQN